MATFTNPDAYIKALTKRGFRALGQGFYSVVLGKPGCSQVVKVCRNATDVWPLYAEWAFHNPGPFVPRIHSLKWHGNGKFFVAVLDRMVETLHDRQYSSEVTGKQREKAKAILGALSNRYTGLSYVLTAFDKAGYRAEARFLRHLQTVFPHAYFDIHGNNWMYDASGALILTDPFSEDKMAVVPKRLKRAAPALLAA
jgi:hypothetical protein